MLLAAHSIAPPVVPSEARLQQREGRRYRRTTGGWVLVACLLVLSGAGVAHAESRFELDAPFNVGLDRSYVFYSPSRIRRVGDAEPSHLVFEAQVAPNLFLPQLHIGHATPTLGEYIISAVVTPNIRLRMLAQESSPVIPPSFMPKLTLQVAHLWKPTLDEAGQPRRFALSLVNLVVGHYSNGQAGCFYENQEEAEHGCATVSGRLPLNETSGDFSTNFIRLEAQGRVVGHIDMARRSAWTLGASAFIERNSSLAFGGITSEMREVYGDGHLGFGLMLERMWFEHRFRVEGNLGGPFGETPRQRWTLNVEAAILPRWAAGFGAFARYVRGQDALNILFLQPVSLVQFGLIFELGPGLRARTSPTGDPLGAT
ncbi:hypothetical protein LZ198_08025 [Myxococcus sp. K15C18031901]|uniref:hypothetical protein n=1 Tax=Myxococcus dinghuensis TaxID=2906761 RepID=UPI0020A720E0|nr:hypothetical protein [Myxococcus dinghuensis]MCP3098821.1 hypothetical protein [Myxococcus dinghuensis]